MDDPIGSPYANLQLARALRAALDASNATAGERADRRVGRWMSVLRGLSDGTLAVGSREPAAGWPVWVTLEVATGGFATGAALAGGPLREHERALARDVGLPDDAPPAALRFALNTWFLSDAGQTLLTRWLASGDYAVDVPEEGAWLTIAWLLANGDADAALALVDTLSPFFDRLRFYPRPTVQAPSRPGTVCLQDAGTTAAQLRELEAPVDVARQREALTVWAPLYDRIVALFLETVEGDLPVARRRADGGWERDPGDRFVIDGAWPCARWPDTWHERARTLLAEADAALVAHTGCRRPRDAGTSLGLLLEHLRVCVLAPQRLDGRAVGRIRLVLARYLATRGAPDSPACGAMRGRELAHAVAPTRADLAACVAGRLDAWPPTRGLDEPGALAGPVGADEVTRLDLPAGTPVPGAVVRRLERCRADTPEGLVMRGLVRSSEMLADLLPELTADIRAQALGDASLQCLYAALLRAFARRRSLLLLDLRSQARAGELPWIAAILARRVETSPALGAQREALDRIAALAVFVAPQSLLPNKLLRELGALGRGAGLDLPFTEELAADIFMGQFAPKFERAAIAAGHFLRGTLYARYYDIDDAAIALSAHAARAAPDRPDPRFAELCARRADAAGRVGHSVAANGMLIEQQQILTTHNLATLADALGMTARWRAFDGGLARRCFAWILETLRAPTAGHHASLIRLKNTAYAWRQMVFFLSLDAGSARSEFLAWAQAELDRRSDLLHHRFAPALVRLSAVERAPVGCDVETLPGRIFLGWTTGRHWLAEEDASR